MCGRLHWPEVASSSSSGLAEHGVVLLGHSDERGPPAELFEFGGPHVGAGRPQSPKNIQNSVLDVPFVRHFHSLALRGSGRKRRYLFQSGSFP